MIQQKFHHTFLSNIPLINPTFVRRPRVKQILCISNQPWSSSPGRTQQLISRLRDTQILYFSPAAGRNDRSWKENGRKVRPNVTVYTLPPLPLGISEHIAPLFRAERRRDRRKRYLRDDLFATRRAPFALAVEQVGRRKVARRQFRAVFAAIRRVKERERGRRSAPLVSSTRLRRDGVSSRVHSLALKSSKRPPARRAPLGSKIKRPTGVESAL
jgi:hypothetical protein